jgi:autotransporter-associated beta strand protein
MRAAGVLELAHGLSRQLKGIAMSYPRACPALAAALALALAPPAAAQTWTGSVGGSWATAVNWSPNGVPASGIDTALTFGPATTAAMTDDIAGPFLLNQMTFAAGGPAYTLAGNALDFRNSSASASPQIAFNTANGVTIADAVTLTGGLSVIGTGTGTLTLNGPLSGGGGLTVSGAGTVALGGGSNTYTGNTVVASGTLLLTNGSAIPTGGNVIVGGGQFNTDGLSNTPATAIGRLTVNGSGSFRVPSGSGDYYLNQLQMTGGTVDFTGSTNFWLHFVGNGAGITTNTASAATVWIGAGTSRIQNDTSGPLAITVNPSFLPSGIDLDDGIALANGVNGQGFVVTGPGAGTAGTMRLTNLGNTANIAVSNGRLRVDDISSNGGVGALGSGTLTLSGSSTTLLYGGPTATSTKAITIGGSPHVLVFPNGTNLTLSGAITESAAGTSLGIDGPGVAGASSTVTLAATNNYSGFTTVRGNGVLAVPALANGGLPSPIGSSSSAPANLILGDVSASPNTRGTMLYTGGSTSTDRGATVAGVYANGGGGAIGVQNAATTLTVSGLITGSGSFVKTGPGTLLLTSGSNSYTGGTFVEGGTLRLISGGSLPAGGAVNLVAGTLDLNGFSTSIGSLGGAAGTVVQTGGASLTAGSDNTNTTFAGNMLGGNLYKTGTGVLTLSGTGNTANVNVTAGAVQVPDMASLGTGTVTMTNFAALNYSGPTETSAKPLTVSASGSVVITSANTNLTLTGMISESVAGSAIQFAGPLNYVFPGTGTVMLTANNTYTGATYVNSQVVVAIPTISNGGVASPIGASTNVPANLRLGLPSFGGRGDLLLTGTNAAYSTDRGAFLAGVYLFPSGGAFLSGGAIGVQNAGTALTWMGQLTSNANDGSLIKTSPGTLTLTNTTNNYAGGTYIEGGALSVGVAGPVIPVNSNVTVFGGATFQVGFTSGNYDANPIGTLTLDGGTLRIPAGNPYYNMNRLTTTAAGGTIDLTGSAGTVFLFGTNPGVTINGNSTWLGTSAFSAIDNFTTGQADLTIAPNVTLTSHVPLATSFQILGGGTLYMVAPANFFFMSYTVSQGRLRVDDLSVTNNNSVLGYTAFGPPVTLDGGILQYGGPTQTSPMPIALTLTGGTIEVTNATTTLTLTTSITGPGPLTKAGPGVLVLANAQIPNASGITVSGGRLEVSGDAQLGIAAITVNPFGTLRYTASTTTGRTFTLAGGTLEALAGVTLTLNGAAVGGGFLRGAGTFVLTGGAALSGVTTYNSTAISQTGPASVNNLTNGGNFTNATGQTLTWGGGVNAAAGRLTVNGTANVSDWSSAGQVAVNPGGTMAAGAGGVVLGGGSVTTVGGYDPATGQVTPGGTLNFGGGNMVVRGGFVRNNGVITGTGDLVIDYLGLVKGAGDIRTVQELLGHKDVKTTMLYCHVLNRGGRGVRSPLDGRSPGGV